MGKKKVFILIVVSVLLIGFTIYSIVSDDLNTVQMIFGKTTETASTEVSHKDDLQSENETSGLVNLGENTTDNEVENSLNNNIAENATVAESKENTTTNTPSLSENTVADNDATQLSLSSINPVGNSNEGNDNDQTSAIAMGSESSVSSNNVTPINNTTSLASNNSHEDEKKQNNVTTMVGATQTGNNTNNTIANKATNEVDNNTIVNKNKLPATGATKFLMWLLIGLAIIAIISVISNIKYRDIPLK